MSWDEILAALSTLWARQKPELLQLVQPGLYKAQRLALVGAVGMAVLLAALLVVRLVKKQKKGLLALGLCFGVCAGASAALYLPRPVLAVHSATASVSVSVLAAEDDFTFAPSTNAQANAQKENAQAKEPGTDGETQAAQAVAQIGQVPAEARKLTMPQGGTDAVLKALNAATRTPTLRENLPAGQDGQQVIYVTVRMGTTAHVVCLTSGQAYVQEKTENAVVYRIVDGGALYETVRAACL